ncbi:MAG: 16S rRNA (cytosine(967)-C(5))-methyltransferase RsmB [Deltaproteobacteria bacterium]|nr:16S rRNA (cytosine(967)-C(5))-methyltransferase RsmB [Deltaproteobacteria bacterium]
MLSRHSAATVSRELAVKILNEVDKGVYAETTLSQLLSKNAISDRDRSLTTEIVYGTVRWKDRLDSIIDGHLTLKGKKLDPEIRNILRIAFYQILFLTRIPVYSVTHQAVAQAKTRLKGRFSKLVNAVLRSVLRNQDDLHHEPEKNSQSLAIYYSHPEWLVVRWLDRFGEQGTIDILEFNNQRSHLTIRINTLKTTIADVVSNFKQNNIIFEIIDNDLGVLTVKNIRGPVLDVPGFNEGLFTVQDFASQMIAPLLKAQRNQVILDVCGAPGGKSSHVAALVNNEAQITLVDADIKRLDEAAKNFERLGVNCVKMIHGDATEKLFLLSMGKFDRILIDAPCSNLGVLRHNCEVKYRVKPQDLARLAEKQLIMLTEASHAVKNDGIIVYCVCSTSEEETTSVVEKFLAGHRNFSVDKIDHGEIFNPAFLTTEGYFFSFPSAKSSFVDGFFAARIKKSRP